jgi:hypothetical protein
MHQRSKRSHHSTSKSVPHRDNFSPVTTDEACRSTDVGVGSDSDDTDYDFNSNADVLSLALSNLKIETTSPARFNQARLAELLRISSTNPTRPTCSWLPTTVRNSRA